MKNTPDTPINEIGLIQLIQMGNFIATYILVSK